MTEENQVTKEPQGKATQPPSGTEPVQQIMKEPQRVTTKNPKKVEAGKRLAESNHKQREVKEREEQVKSEKSRVNQYYGIGAVLALGVIGGLGDYICRSKKVEQPQKNKPHPQPQTNKFEMD